MLREALVSAGVGGGGGIGLVSDVGEGRSHGEKIIEERITGGGERRGRGAQGEGIAGGGDHRGRGSQGEGIARGRYSSLPLLFGHLCPLHDLDK